MNQDVQDRPMAKTLVEEWFENSHLVHKKSNIGSLECVASQPATSAKGRSIIKKWAKLSNPET